MNITDSRRLEYIDAVKAVSILMIMMGHITDLNNNPLDIWMSSCKITVFYGISGFLIAHTNGFQKRSPGEFTANICRTIMWPYLTFSVIAILAKAYYSFSNTHSLSDAFAAVRHYGSITVFLRGINSMWFMPTLFFGELIILLLYISPKVFRYIFAVVGLLGVRLGAYLTDLIADSGASGIAAQISKMLINTLSKSITAAWFIGFGYLAYRFLSDRSLLEGRPGRRLALGAVITVLNMGVSQLNRSVDFNMLSLGKQPVLFVLGGTVGLFGLIFLMQGITGFVSTSALNYWGKNSLILMCTHTALGFRALAVKGWAKVAHIPKHICKEYYIQNFMVLFLLMFMMCGVIELINNHLPFLTVYPGRKSKENKER